MATDGWARVPRVLLVLAVWGLLLVVPGAGGAPGGDHPAPAGGTEAAAHHEVDDPTCVGLDSGDAGTDHEPGADVHDGVALALDAAPGTLAAPVRSQRSAPATGPPARTAPHPD